MGLRHGTESWTQDFPVQGGPCDCTMTGLLGAQLRWSLSAPWQNPVSHPIFPGEEECLDVRLTYLSHIPSPPNRVPEAPINNQPWLCLPSSIFIAKRGPSSPGECVCPSTASALYLLWTVSVPGISEILQTSVLMLHSWN